MNRLSGLFLCRILAATGMDEDFHYMANQYRELPSHLGNTSQTMQNQTITRNTRKQKPRTIPHNHETARTQTKRRYTVLVMIRGLK